MMETSTDILAFASQILAFLGFLATCIAVLRYLNPGPEYIVLADLVGQVRQSWTEYEGEGMPADEYSISFLSTLERLEGEVRDLLFVMNTKSVKCQLRAWANACRIKKLSDRAQLLRIGLHFIVQVNRELRIAQKHPKLTNEDLIALEKMSRSRSEFMRLIEGDVLHIPPVSWSPSLENFHFRQIDNTLSRSKSNDSFSDISTLPGSPTKMVTSPEPVFFPPSQTEDLEAGKLSNNKKRSILKKLLSGVRRKPNSCNSDSELPSSRINA